MAMRFTTVSTAERGGDTDVARCEFMKMNSPRMHCYFLSVRMTEFAMSRDADAFPQVTIYGGCFEIA